MISQKTGAKLLFLPDMIGGNLHGYSLINMW